jgi:nitrite reductase/ring-hydroxylating ferredoxin subunit/uncharacterized membrane protein
MSARLLETFVGRLENDDRLERLGDAVRPGLSKAIGAGRRLDALTGRWLGHPLHPAAVLLPTATWTAAAVLDATGDPRLRPAAQRLVGIGTAAAAPAAASGSADWLFTEGAEKRVGAAHALANGTATGFYAASWLLRRRGRHRTGIALSTIATVLVGAAGFLGGHLTYRRGVGVHTGAFLAGPTDWARLELADEPTGEAAVSASVGDVPLVAVEGPDGSLHVLEDRCTHRGAALSRGEVRDGCIVCPWHDSAFDLDDGAVVRGPASVPQPVYETRRTEGGIEIRRAEPGALRRFPARTD